MKKTLIFCCFVSLLGFFSAPTHASTTVDKIQAMIAKPEILCGQFNQQKKMVGLKAPLKSSGRFCVVENKGVLWRTLSPFKNSVRLTKDEITQLRGDRVTLKLSTQQEPSLKMVNSVLFSLLSGDITALDATFNVDAHTQGSLWTVALKARSPSLANAIGNVTLDGGRFIQRISIIEPNGDSTSIVFSELKTGNKAITKEDASQL